MKKFFNRLINVVLIIIIVICIIFLIPQVWQLYQEWQLKKDLDTMVVGDQGLVNPNWDELKAQNPDIVAWISIPDTPINYPIVKSDNNDFYLTHDSKNRYSQFGSIFMEANNNPDFSDQNTIIYGHNVAGNSSMFSRLTKFLKPDFFNDHPYVYILTPTNKYRCEVMSVNNVLEDNDIYYTNFGSQQKFINTIDQVVASGAMKRDIDFNGQDHLVTLSTCDLRYGLNSPNRIIVLAKLVNYDGDVYWHS